LPRNCTTAFCMAFTPPCVKLQASSTTMVVLQHLAPLTRLDICSGKRVRVLWIADCTDLRAVQLVSGGLAALQILKVKSCRRLEEVKGFSTLRALTRLELCGCSIAAVRLLWMPEKSTHSWANLPTPMH
jgi:hypothetical protein